MIYACAEFDARNEENHKAWSRILLLQESRCECIYCFLRHPFVVQLHFAFQCSCFWVLALARARANWSPIIPIALSFGQKNDLNLLHLGWGSRDGILPKWRPSGLRLGESLCFSLPDQSFCTLQSSRDSAALLLGLFGKAWDAWTTFGGQRESWMGHPSFALSCQTDGRPSCVWHRSKWRPPFSGCFLITDQVLRWVFFVQPGCSSICRRSVASVGVSTVHEFDSCHLALPCISSCNAKIANSGLWRSKPRTRHIVALCWTVKCNPSHSRLHEANITKAAPFL